MRIGIYCNRLLNIQKTGLHWYAFNLVHHLAKIDKKNSYILYNFAFREFQMKKKMMKTYLPSQENFKNKLCAFSSHLAIHIPVDLLIGRIDMLHALDPEIKVYTTLKAKRIVTIHDLIPWIKMTTDVNWSIRNPKRQEREAKLIETSILRSHRIIAVSENTKKDIVKHFSIDPSKITVIYEGKNEIFRPSEDREGLNKIMKKYNISKRFIITRGGNSSRKNLQRLLLSFEKTRKKDNYQLVIFGNVKRKDEWYKMFENSPAGIKEDIIFTNYVPTEDLPYLYSAAEFFINPSLYEGFGLPILEAMACGCPVITSNVSSMPEVAGDAGILIDPYNIDEMAESMERLLADERLREQLRAKGLERARLFTWEKTARETLKVYEEVYNEK